MQDYLVIGTDTLARRFQNHPGLEEFQAPERTRILLATTKNKEKAEQIAETLNEDFNLLMNVTVEEAPDPVLSQFEFKPSSSPDVEDDQYILKADECYHVQCHPAGYYFSAAYIKDIGDNKVIYRDLGTFKTLDNALRGCIMRWEIKNGKK